MSKKMKKNYLICLIAVAIGFLLLCLLFDTGILGKKSAYFNGLVVIGMFYTIIVCSLNLLTGYMGEFSLGHAGFMSIGAYASAIVTTLIQDQTDLPAVLLYLIAIIVGGLAAGLIGVLVGIPALRLSGDYLCIVTVAPSAWPVDTFWSRCTLTDVRLQYTEMYTPWRTMTSHCPPMPYTALTTPSYTARA